MLVHDGGKVAREIVGVTLVGEGKSKGKFQRDLGRPSEFAVVPELTINRHLTAGSNSVQERLTVTSKRWPESYDARNQQDTFSVGDGHFVDSDRSSPCYEAEQVVPTRVYVSNIAAFVHELLVRVLPTGRR